MISLATQFRLALVRRGLFTLFVVCTSLAAISLIAFITLLASSGSQQIAKRFFHVARDEAEALRMAETIATFDLPKGYRLDDAWQIAFYTHVVVLPKTATRHFRIVLVGASSPIGSPAGTYSSPQGDATSFAASFNKQHPECLMELTNIETITIKARPVHLAVMSCENAGQPLKAELGEIPGNVAFVSIKAIGDTQHGFDHSVLIQLLHSIR